MRLLVALLSVAASTSALVSGVGCSKTADLGALPDGGGDGGYGATDQVDDDAASINSCEEYAPAGASCKSGGVCGVGEVNDTDFLCKASIDICCVPATALHIDAGVDSLPDGGVVVNPPDAAVQHDAGRTGHDAGETGHDAGQPAHDAGHDAGTPPQHDAGHDAGMKPVDAGKPHDATHG